MIFRGFYEDRLNQYAFYSTNIGGYLIGEKEDWERFKVGTPLWEVEEEDEEYAAKFLLSEEFLK